MYTESYTHNNLLKIKSLGNGNTSTLKTEKFSNNLSNPFQVMSPELQKLLEVKLYL